MNGVRDDDHFIGAVLDASIYSLRNESMQVLFKEYGRKGSNDRQSSFLSHQATTTKSQKRRDQGTSHLILKFEWIRVALIFPLADAGSSSVRRLDSPYHA